MLCENIKEIRRRKGLTQTQLADLIGVQRAVISKYESGMVEPPIKTLQKIANALGISTYALLDVEEPQKPNHFWTADLEDALRRIGFSLDVCEEDAMIFINYPDGTLEVTDADLRELDESTKSFLRFKLEELRQKNSKDFRAKK
ncbi:helix-turn-helix domain-containing protein [Anaerotruncus rubiinfantis]|uniref:helix-turn-helix domain-containing protein n=1 Tax=Anaerotruncus rubiinfantis TaxID=1720200 RepID=UPI0034A4B98D